VCKKEKELKPVLLKTLFFYSLHVLSPQTIRSSSACDHMESDDQEATVVECDVIENLLEKNSRRF
jgi:hypothetical protein